MGFAQVPGMAVDTLDTEVSAPFLTQSPSSGRETAGPLPQAASQGFVPRNPAALERSAYLIIGVPVGP